MTNLRVCRLTGFMVATVGQRCGNVERDFARPLHSGGGPPHSKTLARSDSRVAIAKRLGVRQSPGALSHSAFRESALGHEPTPVRLEIRLETAIVGQMKFFLALAVYVAMAFVLGLGIYLAVHGKFWLLVLGGISYVLAFARFGCASR